MENRLLTERIQTKTNGKLLLVGITHFLFFLSLHELIFRFILCIKGKRRKKRKDQATTGDAVDKKTFAEDNSWN